MRAGHLPYCYLEHHRRRVVEYEIRSLEGDPYASGGRGLWAGDGTRGQAKLWALVVTLTFNNTL
jgi:hypothetical protein